MLELQDLLFTPPKGKTGKIIYRLFLTSLVLGGIGWVAWQIVLILQRPI
ncbi:hypothetical protein [Pedobacter polaris]|nr:hypothetical protein [Pedobacter polaris]